MTWEQVQNNWLPHRLKVAQQWARITGDDLDRINGRRDELALCLQERYGFVKSEAEREIEAWLRTMRPQAA